MNNSEDQVHPFEAENDMLEETRLEALADDPDYWDHLDELEATYGACREWDDVVSVGV